MTPVARDLEIRLHGFNKGTEGIGSELLHSCIGRGQLISESKECFFTRLEYLVTIDMFLLDQSIILLHLEK